MHYTYTHQLTSSCIGKILPIPQISIVKASNSALSSTTSVYKLKHLNGCICVHLFFAYVCVCKCGTYPAVCFVNVIEFFRFIWQLCTYITTNKDALQVEPLALHHLPLVNDFTDQGQQALPLIDSLQKWTNEPVNAINEIKCAQEFGREKVK